MTVMEALQLASQRQRSGQFLDAEAIYRKILAEHPDNPDALFRMGVLAERFGRLDEAIDLVRRSMNGQPPRHEHHAVIASALMTKGDLEPAIAELRKALELKPDFLEAHNNLGLMLAASGQPEEAIACFERTRRMAPHLVEPNFNIANIWTQMGNHEKAVIEYQNTLKLRPDWPECLNNLGRALRLVGGTANSAAAAECFSRAVQIDPKFATGWANLGSALFELQRHEQAVSAFTRAIELQPRNLRYYVGMANSYVSINENERALECLEKAIAIDPNDQDVLFKRGSILLNMSRLAEAEAIFTDLLARKPDWSEAYNNLGNALFFQNKFVPAVTAFRRCVELNPKFSDGFHNLGLALKSAKQFEDAAVAYTTCSLMRNDDPWMYWILNEIGEQIHEGNRKAAESSEASSIEVNDSLPALPYIGDKVVLLKCDRPVREQLRKAGLHGGYCIDPTTGMDRWLTIQLAAPPEMRFLANRIFTWLGWLRNEAAMSGTTCTIWHPGMSPEVEEIIRKAAGNDFIEVSGDNAQEIHAQLAQHAIPVPDTDGKFFAIVSIRNGGLELLPHWLEYYTRLGVDKILMGVFGDVANESRRQIDDLAQKYRFERFTQRWVETIEEDMYGERYTACRRAGARPGTWLLHTDLDEFHEFPRPLPEIAAAAAEKKIEAIYGHLADRVAADGSLPAVRAGVPLFEQYPIECRLTGQLLKGGTQKVMLCRYRLRVSPGHHDALISPPGDPPIGKPEDYRVAHFKWHGQLVVRMRWGMEQPHASAVWKEECRRFLKWFDANGGRINYSEPQLMARNRMAAS